MTTQCAEPRIQGVGNYEFSVASGRIRYIRVASRDSFVVPLSNSHPLDNTILAVVREYCYPVLLFILKFVE